MTDSVFKLTKPRLVLLIIIGMFVFPMLLAKFYWGYLNEHGVTSTVNKGILITPARPLLDMVLADAEHNDLPANLLKGHWTYVMLAKATCDDRCEQQLLLTRNARLLVSKDMQRVNRLLVLAYQPGQAFLERMRTEHPQLTVAVLPATVWSEFVLQFQQAIDDIGGLPFFLVDPIGNLMMGYGDQVGSKDVLSDLKRLLKISMIG